MKLTEWYSGDQKPVRIGVYQRNYGHFGRSEVLFSHFDGSNWLQGWYDKEKAAKEYRESIFENIPWRGVAK